ncbi:hypothetical protein AYO38_02585 [bacterium SCGC AG-212-C10]|nr:hypothetical protein AYO38_02585 [bacterium SCGC AG-212-C10]
MLEARDSSHLSIETTVKVHVGHELLGKKLDGYVAPRPGVEGEEHACHAALPQSALYLVAANLFGECHRSNLWRNYK